jgi:hypothetical protein
VDPEFRVHAIDFSRAFWVQDFIPTEKPPLDRALGL